MLFNKKKILNNNIKNQDLRQLTTQEQESLKEMLLHIAKDIDTVCRKYNIKLFLVGGSLLGAVRHSGFIPWDDDIDFGLTRNDYTTFISIFDKELGDNYYLRCLNSKYPNGNRFMQIFRKGTILETAEGSTPLQPKCISIDIFPYDYAPNNKFVRITKGLYCNTLMLIAASVCNLYFENQEYKRIMNTTLEGYLLNSIEKIIGIVFSWKKPEQWFDLVDKFAQEKNKTNFVTSAMGRRHYLGEIFPTEVFFPLKPIQFESLTLYSPQNADAYLKHNYGNSYMTPPPINKRESHFIKKIKI